MSHTTDRYDGLPSAAPPRTTPVDPAGTEPATVLVVAARAGARGATAAATAAATLRDATSRGSTCVVALHAGAPDLADRAATAGRIYVLDPGRVRSWQQRLRGRAGGRPRALTAPARTADRLALLELLGEHRRRVRWITRPAQFPGPAR